MKRQSILLVSITNAIAISAGGEVVGQQGIDYGDLGRHGYASLECAALSQIIGDETNLRFHFQAGFDALTVLLSAALAGNVSEDHWSKIPIGITMNLGGPSIDFMIGVIWSEVSRSKYDEHWEHIDAMSFEDMSELQILRATTDYNASNCDLIR